MRVIVSSRTHYLRVHRAPEHLRHTETSLCGQRFPRDYYEGKIFEEGEEIPCWEARVYKDLKNPAKVSCERCIGTADLSGIGKNIDKDAPIPTEESLQSFVKQALGDQPTILSNFERIELSSWPLYPREALAEKTRLMRIRPRMGMAIDEEDTQEDDPVSDTGDEGTPKNAVKAFVAMIAGLFSTKKIVDEDAPTMPQVTTPETVAALAATFGDDLGACANKWMTVYGASPSPEEQTRIIIAGYVALCTRRALVERILRKTTPKETLRRINKDAESIAAKFLARAADGQPGIRRVK